MEILSLSSKNSFPPLLHLTFVLQQLSDSQLLPKVGIGLGQVRIMSVLSGSVPCSQSMVAKALHQTEANVSRQLRLMKKQGLVSIMRSKKDARLREVKLTAKGTQKYKIAAKVLSGQQAEFMKLLESKELEAFERASNNLLAGTHIKTGTRRRIIG